MLPIFLLSRRVLFPALLFLAVTPLCRAQSTQTNNDAALNALAGEYTPAIDPDTPLSFYSKDGKLYVESERLEPTTLTEVTATEFQLGPHTTFRFAGTVLTLVHEKLVVTT